MGVCSESDMMNEVVVVVVVVAVMGVGLEVELVILFCCVLLVGD
jgi:hypothetical protein